MGNLIAFLLGVVMGAIGSGLFIYNKFVKKDPGKTSLGTGPVDSGEPNTDKKQTT
jgi:hypothetical protein